MPHRRHFSFPTPHGGVGTGVPRAQRPGPLGSPLAAWVSGLNPRPKEPLQTSTCYRPGMEQTDLDRWEMTSDIQGGASWLSTNYIPPWWEFRLRPDLGKHTWRTLAKPRAKTRLGVTSVGAGWPPSSESIRCFLTRNNHRFLCNKVFLKITSKVAIKKKNL